MVLLTSNTFACPGGTISCAQGDLCSVPLDRQFEAYVAYYGRNTAYITMQKSGPFVCGEAAFPEYPGQDDENPDFWGPPGTNECCSLVNIYIICFVSLHTNWLCTSHIYHSELVSSGYWILCSTR